MRRPRRLKQVENAGCWLTCLAMLTGLPQEMLEAYAVSPRASERRFQDMYRQVNRYLGVHGWRVVSLGRYCPAGWAIGSGRAKGGGRLDEHSHVVRDGGVWQDPSPYPVEVPVYTQFEIVVPLVPAVSRVNDTA